MKISPITHVSITGNGKNELVNFIAGKLKATLIKCSGASLLNKYVGGSQKKIRGLFEIAKDFKNTVIIFIDEVFSMLLS